MPEGNIPRMPISSAFAKLSAGTPVERDLKMRSRECGVPVRGAAPATRTQWNLYCSALRLWTAVAVVIALLVYSYLGQGIGLLGGAALAAGVIWIALRRSWLVWIAAGALLLQQYLI
jgi:hypothetical protein